MPSLPIIKPTKFSDRDVVRFFDTRRSAPLEYNANDVDAAVGFFKNRGFDETAAISTATVLLQQAKIDEVNVFRVLDTLEGLTEVQLSQVVSEVLNVNRPKSSALGFKVQTNAQLLENRNIEQISTAPPALVQPPTVPPPDPSITEDYVQAGYVEDGYVGR
jgi:hypothetical protein